MVAIFPIPSAKVKEVITEEIADERECQQRIDQQAGAGVPAKD
jgi:hypothetical protein